MALVSGAELLVRSLQVEGVGAMFAITDISFTPLSIAAEKAGMLVVAGRHESAQVHMADAWARATGVPALVVGGMGPGVANLLPGVVNAWIEGVPVVVVGTQRSSRVDQAIRRNRFQYTPQLELFRPVTKLRRRRPRDEATTRVPPRSVPARPRRPARARVPRIRPRAAARRGRRGRQPRARPSAVSGRRRSPRSWCRRAGDRPVERSGPASRAGRQRHPQRGGIRGVGAVRRSDRSGRVHHARSQGSHLRAAPPRRRNGQRPAVTGDAGGRCRRRRRHRYRRGRRLRPVPRLGRAGHPAPRAHRS